MVGAQDKMVGGQNEKKGASSLLEGSTPKRAQ